MRVDQWSTTGDERLSGLHEGRCSVTMSALSGDVNRLPPGMARQAPGDLRSDPVTSRFDSSGTVGNVGREAESFRSERLLSEGFLLDRSSDGRRVDENYRRVGGAVPLLGAADDLWTATAPKQTASGRSGLMLAASAAVLKPRYFRG